MDRTEGGWGEGGDAHGGSHPLPPPRVTPARDRGSPRVIGGSPASPVGLRLACQAARDGDDGARRRQRGAEGMRSPLPPPLRSLPPAVPARAAGEGAISVAV